MLKLNGPEKNIILVHDLFKYTLRVDTSLGKRSPWVVGPALRLTAVYVFTASRRAIYWFCGGSPSHRRRYTQNGFVENRTALTCRSCRSPSKYKNVFRSIRPSANHLSCDVWRAKVSCPSLDVSTKNVEKRWWCTVTRGRRWWWSRASSIVYTPQ